MTKLIHREGNIWTTDARAIGQGVNLRGVMGSGIALQFKSYFPEMFEEYKSFCERGRFLPGDVHVWDVPRQEGQPQRFIFNLSSQIEPGANASYRLLLLAVQRALKLCDTMRLGTLALPRIGSGIGGLNELKVEGILEALAESYKTDIELWTYKP
ncbi:ADP-ribosylglycohydrolase [Microbacterium phage Cece]|nr:ADP-ribosylglycohydrolase [Microbacterium phage Cece]